MRDYKRSSVDDKGFLLAYNPQTKKFIITSRKDCHSNPNIMHYGVYCFVHASDRKYALLQKRGETDLYGYKWTCPVSGHVELGESFLEAVIREWEEELKGTDVRYAKKASKKGVIEVKNEFEWESKMVYDVEVDPFEICFRLGSEIYGFAYFRVDKLRDMINKHPEEFTPGLIKAYESFFKTP